MAELSTGTIPYEYSLDTASKMYDSVIPGVESTLNGANVTADTITEIFQSAQGAKYKIVHNADGTIRNYTVEVTEKIADTASDIGSAIDSNIGQGAKMTSQIPLNTVADETAKVTFKGGLATAGKFVATEVLPAVSAVGVGITLGKTFDALLYKAMPDVWDAHGMWSLNPETWDSITSESAGLGTRVFNGILGINPETEESQQYLDENALAYIAYYMQTKNIFAPGEYETDYSSVKSKLAYPDAIYTIHPFKEVTITAVDRYRDLISITDNESSKVYLYAYHNPVTDGHSIAGVSDKPFKIKVHEINASGSELEFYNNSTYYKGDRYGNGWYRCTSGRGYAPPKSIINQSESTWSATPLTNGSEFDIEYAMLFGTTTEKSAVDGVGTQDDATVPDLTNATSVTDALTILKETLPELWEKAVTQQVVQSDGSVKEYVYVPIGTATVDTQNATQPTSGTQTQADTAVKATDTQGIIDFISNLIGGETTPGEENTDSTTGGGITPPIVIPSGSASALYKIYNPSQSELNSFGGWLWSSDFVDQLLKLFNDPMQAIIGLHKVYCPVTIGGSTTIKVGYLDSGVSSNYVSGQYSTIDCGSVSLAENFGNVFDYDPYTKVFIYLPFIGIQQLNTGDVMRSTINVKYQCDVLTGACLAEINVKRDGAGGTLYTYTGNCAVQYPISSGSYMGIVASLASVAGGVVGSVASGGALAPIAMGAVSGIMNAHTSIAHSGSFSGNAGAMGNKKPYLIIVRPQTELATTFPQTDGYPVNYSAVIGSCTGYIEIENCHISGIPATDAELAEIESLLKGGVFV